MLQAYVAILIVTFFGAGKVPQTEVALVPDAATCAQAKLATEAALEKDPKIAGFSFTCAPVAVAFPGKKS
jgi:hypothetical protein